MSDLNDILSWPHPSRLYEFDEIPMERDLVMVGAGQLEDLRREWARYLSELGQGEPRSPDEKIDGRWCAIEGRTKDSFDLNVCITVTTRYHGAVKKLPRSKFVLCIDFWNHAKSPYLVVDQSWFDEIGRETFSLYALVDAVGMRSLLDRQGRITAGQLARLREGLDVVAGDRLDHAFLSFADSVLVKSNWTAGEYESTYRPEDFIEVTERVCIAIEDALDLKSYAVVTQGANAADDASLLHVSEPQNHIFFGSLAAPFAELFDIDRTVRASIRAGRHPPRQLYVSATVFWSLRFGPLDAKDRLSESLVPFASELTTPDGRSYRRRRDRVTA
jgi:hypothetical protein